MLADEHLQPKIGEYGEYLAAEYLRNKGWQVLDRNIRWKFGEIDIVALDSAKTLVFVEVKTLRGSGNSAIELVPEDNLSAAKLNKMKRMAQIYANRNPQLVDNYHGWRIDLIAIVLTGNIKDYEINQYQNL